MSPDFEKRQARAAELARELLSQVSAELKEPAETSAMPLPDISDVSQLPDEISEIRRAKERPHVIRRRIAEVASAALNLREVGFLCRSTAQGSYFMDKRAGFLHSLSSEKFERFLATITGLNKTEAEFAFVLEHLKIKASNLPEQPVHTLSFFDEKEEIFYMHSGKGDIHLLDERGPLIRKHNGDGIIFLSPEETEAFEPDYNADGEALDWLLKQASFAEDEAGLTRADQRILLVTALLFLLFSKETRPILVAIGPMGTCKTTLLRMILMLFLGSRFNTTAVPADRPIDDIVMILRHEPVAVLDNMDSFIKGSEDLFATFVTGADYKRRKLYTDDDRCIIRLNTKILGITTRSPRFNRADIGDRVIPFRFEKPAGGEIDPNVMRAELLKRRNAIMGDLLKLASKAIRSAKIEVPRLHFRLADFAHFGWRLWAQQLEDGRWSSPGWEGILSQLQAAQDEFVSADNPIIEVLDAVLDDAPVVDVLVSELFGRCKAKADDKHTLLPRTASTFGKLLNEMKRAIERELRVVMTIKTGHAGRRRVTIIETESRHAGDLSKVSEDPFFKGRPPFDAQDGLFPRPAAVRPQGVTP